MRERGAKRVTFRRRATLWGVAVRAYAYPASIVPVLLGSVYAWYARGVFLPGHFLLALCAGMLYHTGCNLLNDYYDYRYGVDRDEAFGGSGLLVRGLMTPRQIALGAWACLAAGSLVGFYFVCLYGIPVLAIGGVVYLGYIIALLYFSFLAPHTRDITGKKGIILVAVWVIGICWYLVWKYVSRRQGVNVSELTYRELPPE